MADKTRESRFKARLIARRDVLRAEIRAALQASGEERHRELAGAVHDAGDDSVADLLTDVNLKGMDRDARELAATVGDAGEVVMLGSIAGPKYVEPLQGALGGRLLFPVDFVGRGDMSRGGLLLRAADAGVELAYAQVKGAIRHGARPPKLLPRKPRGD